LNPYPCLSAFIRVHPRPNKLFVVRSLAGKICVYSSGGAPVKTGRE
jgi:hypothetical protein